MLNTRQTKRNNLHMNLIHSHLTNVKPGKEKKLMVRGLFLWPEDISYYFFAQEKTFEHSLICKLYRLYVIATSNTSFHTPTEKS